MSYGESQREKQNALYFARSANVFSQRLTLSSFLKGAAALTKGFALTALRKDFHGLFTNDTSQGLPPQIRPKALITF